MELLCHLAYTRLKYFQLLHEHINYRATIKDELAIDNFVANSFYCQSFGTNYRDNSTACFDAKFIGNHLLSKFPYFLFRVFTKKFKRSIF